MASSDDSGSGAAQYSRLLLTPVRAVWRSSKRIVHKLLHPARHRLARRVVQKVGVPHSILFVCLGNICRSPYAARAILRELPPGWSNLMRVDSAGFIGPDRPAPTHAIAVAARRGVDLSDHRSKLMTRPLVDSAALVAVMEPRQRSIVLRMAKRSNIHVILLGDLRPHAGERRSILDPFDGDRDRFEQSYDEVDSGIKQLAAILSRSHG